MNNITIFFVSLKCKQKNKTLCYPTAKLLKFSIWQTTSANFYNKSDYVLAVHRDREEDDETVTIRVDKVKFSHYGTQGKCYLKYDVKSGNYYNAPDMFDFDEESEYKPIPFALPELPKKKEPLDVVVSLYSGSADNIGTDVCLKDFLLTDKCRNIVEQIRTGKTSEERKEIKSKLSHKIPCVTISGRFTKRGKDYLISQSGLMAIDIDLKDNKDIISQVPDILKNLPYVAYYGKSISGDGYFAVVPIENPNHFKQHFYAIEEEMKSLGIVIDKACKDVTRLRYASYDENYFYNPNATTYYWEKDETVEIKKVDKDKVRKTDFIQTLTMSDKEMVERQLDYLKKNICLFLMITIHGSKLQWHYIQDLGKMAEGISMNFQSCLTNTMKQNVINSMTT